MQTAMWWWQSGRMGVRGVGGGGCGEQWRETRQMATGVEVEGKRKRGNHECKRVYKECGSRVGGGGGTEERF